MDDIIPTIQALARWIDTNGYRSAGCNLELVAGDFARWGRLGGLETLQRYGRPWFALLGQRRWGRVGQGVLDHYRAQLRSETGGMTAAPFLFATPCVPRRVCTDVGLDLT